MPPFANSEGIAGMETAIRSKVPVNSVFKYNPQLLFAMVSENTGVNHAYGRNFTSNTYPLPIPKTLDDVYDFIRAQTGGTVKEPLTSGLVYSHLFCDPEDSDDDW